MKEKFLLIKNKIYENVHKFKELEIEKNNWFIVLQFILWFIVLQFILLFYFVSFNITYPFLQTIYHFFNDSLFNNDSLFKIEVLKKISNDSFFIHSKMLTLGFILLILLIVKRSLSFFEFTLTFIIVFLFPIYEWIDFYIHETIFKTGIYSPLLRNGEKQINPQYTRIFLFLLGFIYISILVIKKKTRTIDRVFMFLIAGAIILTTFLFHIAIPMGTLKLSKNEKITSFHNEIIEVPIYYACRNKNCYVFDTEFNQETKNILLDSIKEEQQNIFIEEAKKHFKQKGNKNIPYLKSIGNFIGTDVTFSACLYRIKENKILCVFDNQQMIYQGLLAKTWFSLLTGIAHFIWIFFGFLLLFLHKYNKIQKIIKKK